jgi:hypothetical protein
LGIALAPLTKKAVKSNANIFSLISENGYQESPKARYVGYASQLMIL